MVYDDETDRIRVAHYLGRATHLRRAAKSMKDPAARTIALTTAAAYRALAVAVVRSAKFSYAAAGEEAPSL